MLEVTVYKSRHFGVAEAKRMRGPIEQSDIFCPENSSTEREEADIMEQEIAQMWHSNISRTKAHVLHNEGMHGTYTGIWTPMSEYGVALFDTMFRNKKPFCVLERFTAAESKRLQRLKEESDRLAHEGTIKMFQEREGEKDLYKSIELMVEQTVARDKNIMMNLPAAEERMRALYPRLQDSTLRFGIQIGHCHYPEEFGNAHVVEMTSLLPSEAMHREAMYRVRHGASYQDVAPLIPAFVKQAITDKLVVVPKEYHALKERFLARNNLKPDTSTAT
jgi:hypothetical protein